MLMISAGVASGFRRRAHLTYLRAIPRRPLTALSISRSASLSTSSASSVTSSGSRSPTRGGTVRFSSAMFHPSAARCPRTALLAENIGYTQALPRNVTAPPKVLKMGALSRPPEGAADWLPTLRTGLVCRRDSDSEHRDVRRREAEDLPVERQLRLVSRCYGLRLAEAMRLSLECDIGIRNSVRSQIGGDALRLGGRHDRVIEALQEQHRAGCRVDVPDGRALLVAVLVAR